MKRPEPPLNVLLVEDEALIVMEMQFALEDLGHRVIGNVSTAPEIEHLTFEVDPQLVLIDLNLADGTNGLDACQMVHAKWEHAIVVFVTANPTKIPIDFDGSHGVISKPFAHRSLEQAVKYLSQGICAPPPTVSKPMSFTAFSNFDASWRH